MDAGSVQPALKPLDRFLRSWRYRVAKPYIPPGSRVLDVGCHDGSLFTALRDRVSSGVGIDPDIDRPIEQESYRLVPGAFPDDVDEDEPFDVITMLAVLEHLPATSHERLAEGCVRVLRPGGRIVLTVPSPAVDRILPWLARFRLVDGIHLEEHHHFDPSQVPTIFRHPELRLAARRTFQLGLNNCFCFEKRA